MRLSTQRWVRFLRRGWGEWGLRIELWGTHSSGISSSSWGQTTTETESVQRRQAEGGTWNPSEVSPEEEEDWELITGFSNHRPPATLTRTCLWSTGTKPSKRRIKVKMQWEDLVIIETSLSRSFPGRINRVTWGLLEGDARSRQDFMMGYIKACLQQNSSVERANRWSRTEGEPLLKCWAGTGGMRSKAQMEEAPQ